jgi:hypothetical protein
VARTSDGKYRVGKIAPQILTVRGSGTIVYCWQKKKTIRRYPELTRFPRIPVLDPQGCRAVVACEHQSGDKLFGERLGPPRRAKMSNLKNCLCNPTGEPAVKGQFRTVSYAQKQLWRQFCQLLRTMGHSCPSSPPVSRSFIGAWSLRRIPLAVSHACFVSKISDLANPSVLRLEAGKDMGTGGDTVAGWCRLRSRCGYASSSPIDGPTIAARDTNRRPFD